MYNKKYKDKLLNAFTPKMSDDGLLQTNNELETFDIVWQSVIYLCSTYF